MFTASEKKIPRENIINDFKKKQYCTVAIADYPGEFLRRWDYSFNIVNAPKLDWPSQLKQVLLSHSIFTLSILKFLNPQLRRLTSFDQIFRSLPIHSNAKDFYKQLLELASIYCGQKPVFAFLFSGKTHLPYIQDNSFSCQNDNFYYLGSTPWGPHNTPPIMTQCLYKHSVDNFANDTQKLIEQLNHSQKELTFIVSSDHGEYIKDGTTYNGHGDFLYHLDGLTVPFLVFGPLSKNFINSTEIISNTAIREKLIGNMHSDEKPLLVETEVWFDKRLSPNLRLHYPDGNELFTVESNTHFIIIKPELEDLVESAKIKMFFDGKNIFEKNPTPSGTIYRKNGVPIKKDEVPFFVFSNY